MSLDDLLNVEVTVASKIETSAADAPSSVTVFTQRDIRRLGVMNLQELLNYVPGFQSLREVEQGVSAGIAARGRLTALSESVLVRVDGQPVNDLYSGGISLLNREMAVENIQQVEIIRGPGSALYGANAFLGVIDIKTLRGVTALWTGAGSRDARLAAASASMETGGARINGFARVFQHNGFVHTDVVDYVGRTGTQKNETSAMDASGSLEYKGLTINARHMQRFTKGFLTFAALQDADGNSERTRQSSVSADYTYKKDTYKLSANARYRDDEWEPFQLIFPAGFEIAPGFVLENALRGGPHLKTRVLSAGADAEFKPIEENTIAGGLVFERSRFTRVASRFSHHPITLEYQGEIVEFTDDDLVFVRNPSRSVFGAYLQDTHNIADQLILTAGVRADYYSDFGFSLNPRGAAVYKTPIHSRAKLMYGRAFRAPNYLELHDRNNPVDFGNPDLDPEIIDTVEFAYIQDIPGYLRVSATVFYNRVRDIIVFGAEADPDPENPFDAPTFINEGEQDTQGMELELRATPFDGFDVLATYTHIENRGLRSPRNFGAAAFNYYLGPMNLNLSFVARGKSSALPDQSPYVITNARAEYQIWDGVFAYVNGRNLLDEDYRTPATLIPAGVPNDERMILVGLIAER